MERIVVHWGDFNVTTSPCESNRGRGGQSYLGYAPFH